MKARRRTFSVAVIAMLVAGGALAAACTPPVPVDPSTTTTTTPLGPPGIVATPGAVTVNESGSAVVGVRLDEAPAAGVTVSVSSSDPSKASVVPSSLSFSPANWDVAQNVTINGVQDANAVNEVVVVSLTRPGRAAAAVAVTVVDDDVLSLQVNFAGAPVTVAEGATVTSAFRARLTAQPLATVVMTVSSSDPSKVTVSPTTLTFTPANWSALQDVAVTGVQDADTVDDLATVTFSVAGVGSVSGLVQVLDDDDPVIVTTQTSLSVVEGGSAVIGVSLGGAPAANVTVSVSSSDPSKASVVPSTLTFTPANWNVTQNIIVTGVQDVNALNELVQLTLSQSGLPPLSIPVSVVDDDTEGVLVSGPSPVVVTEGASAVGVFSVRLAAQPQANRTVTVSSSNPTKLSVTPTALTFTPANWNVPQSVTVNGLQDPDTLDEAGSVSFFYPGDLGPTGPFLVNVIDDDI